MKSTNLNRAFGRALAKLRKEKGLTQEYLSFESDLTRTYISLLERGERSPTLNTIVRLTDALGVAAEVLVKQALLEYSNDNRSSLTD